MKAHLIVVCWACLCLVLLGWVPHPCAASVGDGAPPTDEASVLPPEMPTSPHDLVRAGNKRFLAKEFPAALEYYDKAKEGAPDALEVDFNRGLSRFAQGEFEQAREAFERSMLSDDRALADDAVYSLATCAHAEALAAAQANPQDAITKLEQAMRHYQDVLTSNRDHKFARESNRKAATLWRQLKEIQQQQQQGQNQQQDQQEENEDQEQQQQQQSGEDQQDKQDQRQNQPQEGEDQQQQQPEGDEDQQKQAGEEQQEAQAGKKEERASREQAERQLRRLVDRLRRRKQDRQEMPQPVRVRPVEKDW